MSINSIVCMGVCGCGKTTVAKLLAERLNFIFIEGDSFHSATNIEKMKQAIPLTDEDRAGWLEAISVKTIIIKIHYVYVVSIIYFLDNKRRNYLNVNKVTKRS